eukprot:COSAG06_NODE_48661_length_330_cov_1.164502_1_plen_65_part_01
MAQTREVHARHFCPTQVAARAASRRKFPGITQAASNDSGAQLGTWDDTYLYGENCEIYVNKCDHS